MVVCGGIDRYQRNGSGLGLRVSGLACLAVAGWMCFDLVLPKAEGTHGAAIAELSASASATAEPRYVTKKIEDIQPGDLVVARDDVTGQIQRQEVVRLFRKSSDHLRVLTFQHADGTQQTIETTNEHPFWVTGSGWTTAQNLQPGDSVDTADSPAAMVVATRLESHPEGIPVYNFEVAHAHSYFVRQPNSRGPPLWVHNDCGVTVVNDDPLNFQAIVNQDAAGLFTPIPRGGTAGPTTMKTTNRAHWLSQKEGESVRVG
ncbi:MAG: polymorphic toxin-type HINT domain-containing protein [Planctomycetaceae bacterium]